MKDILEKLYSGRSLDKPEARGLLGSMLDPAANHFQIAAVLSAFRMRCLNIEELEGFREEALEKAKRLDLSDFSPIDVCGTGGDGKNTFNISTLSAFVIAACGIKVAKHGGGAVSSKFGSSNILEALGYKFSDDENYLKRQLEEAGICFLHAPLFHPSFKHVAPVRKDMGVKTFFNILGPVCNPSDPSFQIIGVYSAELMELYKLLAQRLNKDIVTVHSMDGCDEISLTSDVKVSDKFEDKIYSPSNFNFPLISYEDIQETERIEDAVSSFISVLEKGSNTAHTRVVAANAALCLHRYYNCANKNVSLVDCSAEALEVIKSGKAFNVFRKLMHISS